MNSNAEQLCQMVTRLRQGGLHCIVFGGWANELTGAIAARPHKDIDLLYVGDDFGKVDAFIQDQWDMKEIPAKHFPHKRAFLSGGIMTEILLLSTRKERFITKFWNELEFEWPDISTICVNVNGSKLSVSTPDVVEYYHRHEKEIARVRARHTSVATLRS